MDIRILFAKYKHTIPSITRHRLAEQKIKICLKVRGLFYIYKFQILCVQVMMYYYYYIINRQLILLPKILFLLVNYFEIDFLEIEFIW